MDQTLVIHFDGSCSINPGGVARYGYEITSESNELVVNGCENVCVGKDATSNLAEWAGLTAALRYLKSKKWSGKLMIYGDSQLVINQLNDKWKCNKPHLRIYLEECLQLLVGMDWTAEWVPRNKNATADSLSRRKR